MDRTHKKQSSVSKNQGTYKNTVRWFKIKKKKIEKLLT